MNTIVDFSDLKTLVAETKTVLASKGSIVRLNLSAGRADVWTADHVHVTVPVAPYPGAPVRVYNGADFAAVVRKLAKVYKGADQVGIDDAGIGGVTLREHGEQPPAPITLPGETVCVIAPQMAIGTFISHLAPVSLAAGDDDEHRAYIAGVQVEACTNTGDLVFVATDGHRLHTSRAGMGIAGAGNVFLPNVIVSALLDAFKGVKPHRGGLVYLQRPAMGNGCIVTVGAYVFRSRDAVHTFVDWRRVVPTTRPCTIEIDTNEACNLARHAKAIVKGRALGAHARVTFGPVARTVTIESVQGHGTITIECPSMHLRGEAVTNTFGINIAYLIDAVEHLTEAGFGPVSFSWVDQWTPVLLESPARQVVIMPVRI